MQKHTSLAALLLMTVVIAGCGGGSEPAETETAAPAESAQSAAPREYPLKGQIISVASDGMEATIKHEDIPNFMAAMTMPYRVRDAKELEPLRPGDLIEATIVVDADGASHLERVTKVGEAPLPADSGAGGGS
jgi:protein SCO1/2